MGIIGSTNPEGQLNTADSSAIDAVVITPSNSIVFDPPLRGLYVGVTGNINLVTANGNTILFSNVPAGLILPVYCAQVLSTNTTATTMIGLI